MKKLFTEFKKFCLKMCSKIKNSNCSDLQPRNFSLLMSMHFDQEITFKRHDFTWCCIEIEDVKFLSCVVFNDMATLQTSGDVYHHYIWNWSNEVLHIFVEHELDSLYVNVRCALAWDHIICSLLFDESTVSGIVLLNILKPYTLLQIVEENLVFHQLGASPSCTSYLWFPWWKISWTLYLKRWMECLTTTLTWPYTHGLSFTEECLTKCP